MKDKIENSVYLDENLVWVLADRKQFNYSDGVASERYLKKVFSHVKDLSSNSYELEQWIKDWPSEYHLSRKRSQLLRGFDFDRSKKILEVGCGCGAITRFLGETFDDVVAIEGSITRARLARMRTKGMTTTSILCAPFQEIKFKEHFDIIFCIGVFEYSGSFVKDKDPYDAILRYFEKMLNPDGVLVLAIENQFGLKYFSSSQEDHTNRMFEGLEGYPYYSDKVRTFGYDELKARIGKYFANIDFYFPYPDYKIPSCVLSEKFLNKVKVGELVGKFKARDYCTDNNPLFDESLVYLELDKNNKLPFFSNSFLIVAGKEEVKVLEPQTLGFLYSTDRAEEFQSTTRFIEHMDKSIWAQKFSDYNSSKNGSGILKFHPTESKWNPGLSLQGLIAQRVRLKNISLEELFVPCKTWLKTLKTISTIDNDRVVVDGKYLDTIWSNSYIDNDDCIFIDQEWEWHEKISLNVIVIRSIYCFLNEISHVSDIHPSLKKGNTKSLIEVIAKSIGIDIERSNFKEFFKLESQFYGTIVNGHHRQIRLKIALYLWNRKVVMIFLNIRKRLNKLRAIKNRIVRYLFRFFLSHASD